MNLYWVPTVIIALETARKSRLKMKKVPYFKCGWTCVMLVTFLAT